MSESVRARGDAPAPLIAVRLFISCSTAMNFFGIALRKPSFNELTAAAVLAIGLWMLFAGLMRAAGHPLGAVDAGAALLVSSWACVGARLGIRLDQGSRHLVASLAGSAVLLALYEGARHALSFIA